MADDSSDEIRRLLAVLSERLGNLQSAFEIERQDSHLSRKETADKVNSVAEDVGTIKGDVKVAGLVAAQARDAAADVRAALEKAAPTIADMDRAKRIGSWVLGGGAITLIGSGLAVLAWGEALKSWLSHWLGIK